MKGVYGIVQHTNTNTSGTLHVISADLEYVDLWHQKMDRLLEELQIRCTHKWKSAVFDTIPILAVWPVLVRYRHSMVGILVGIMTKFFAYLTFWR